MDGSKANGLEDDYVIETCSIPGCKEDLHLQWEREIPFYRRFLWPSATLPTPADAHTGSWKVICEGGHVIAIPGYFGCLCGEDECSHTDFDSSNELRTFRAHDVARIRAL